MRWLARRPLKQVERDRESCAGDVEMLLEATVEESRG